MIAHERVSLIRQKVDRAKKHISDFEIARDRFLSEEPAGVASKFNPQTGEEEFYITHLPVPPIELGLIAGDAIHNLRTALDHLAYELVRANGQSPNRGTAFPIADNATLYQPMQARYAKGMSSNAISAIDATEPYGITEPDSHGNKALWWLHRLDIADKHHALFITLVGGTAMSFVVKGSVRDANFTIGNIGMAGIFKPLIEGKVFSVCQPELHQDVNFTFDVTITEPGVIENKPLLLVLNTLCNTVDNLILNFKHLLD